jgi:hypothetical protein
MGGEGRWCEEWWKWKWRDVEVKGCLGNVQRLHSTFYEYCSCDHFGDPGLIFVW